MRGGSVVVLCDTVGRDGGTESYLERILPELARSGVRISVIARHVSTDSAAFGVEAEEVGWSREHESPNAEAAEKIRHTIAERDPDAVLVSNVFDEAVLSAARLARRFVVRIHDHRPFCPNGDRRFPQFAGNCSATMGSACLGNALLRGCVAGASAKTVELLRARERVRDAMHRADAFVVSSRFMALSCVRNGIDPTRIAIAPPPLAREDFTDSPSPMPRERRILFAGRILPQKGLVSLVRAIAMVPEGRRPVLAVAGASTPEFERAKEIAARSGVQIDHLGRLTPAQMRDAIDASRAVAMPSLWDEPFGLVGIEAQVRARPAVAYAVGGISEWLGDAGRAVRPGDEAALARAIDDVIDDASWEQYSARALERSRDFHPVHHISKLNEVLCVS